MKGFLSIVLLSLTCASVGALFTELTHSHVYDFEQYIKDFGKVYESEEEYNTRKAIFEENVLIIKEHNTNVGSSYKRGVNRFTDMHMKEFRQLLGFKRSDVPTTNQISYRDHRASLPDHTLNSKIPTNVNWTAVDGVESPVKNQGSCGSCWIFSSVETIESVISLDTGKLPILSEQVYVSCTPNPDECGGKGGCQGGTNPIVYNYVMENGVYLESSYPYTSGVNGTDGECIQSDFKPVGGITNYVLLPKNEEQPLLEATAQQPVGISLDASTFKDYSSGVMDFSSCGSEINHAVVASGYGTEEDGTEYWWVRNSWGPDWGLNGYIKLARSTKCAIDPNPSDGTACKGARKLQTVCGTCGMLSYSAYPTGGFLN